MTSVSTHQGFSIDVPEGFIPLPVDEVAEGTQKLTQQFEGLFNLTAGDQNTAKVAEFFAAFGQLIGAGGMEFAAIGLFRSPDEPTRPVSAVLCCTRMPSSHESTDIAIDGLREVHQSQGKEATTLALPAGSAVVVVEENPQLVPTAEGQEPIALLGRTVTAWIPDPTGTAIAAVSVSSNSWQDWAHVCDMALDIFDSFEWEEKPSA